MIKPISAAQLRAFFDDCALAALSMHLGMEEKALHWCERAIARFETPGRTPFTWEVPLVAFARDLVRAVRSGNGAAFLTGLERK